MIILVPRPRSDRVEEVKNRLLRRIADGHYRPGERFLSNRALAQKYELSYQTADRLIRELCAEGHLERRAASGTYLPGRSTPIQGALLCFHFRSRLPGSFGERLLQEMTARLDREGIRFRIVYDDAPHPALPEDWYPVLWEWEHAHSPRSGLLLHRRPPSGMASTRWDSVTVDDFSGGVCAAQILRERVPNGSRWVIVGGPPEDSRSESRIAGFRSVLPAEVVSAGWFVEDGERVAANALEGSPSGIFCANDRLAQGILAQAGADCPPIVGFDDAPIAETLGLTTIAIPWAEMTVAAANTIRQRLLEPQSTGTHQILAPSPVIRW